MSISISNVAAKAAADAVTAKVDLNTPPAVLRIYSGTAPASADTALSGNTLLAQLTMSNPAFAAAINGSPGGRSVANAISDDTDADATGTATFFRIYNGNGTTCVVQGTVTAAGGGGDAIINSVSIVIHTTVKCTSMSLTMPET